MFADKQLRLAIGNCKYHSLAFIGSLANLYSQFFYANFIHVLNVFRIDAFVIGLFSHGMSFFKCVSIAVYMSIINYYMSYITRKDIFITVTKPKLVEN